jgi:hypothetical protein
LRGFERDAVLDLDLQSGGMEFASEMVVKAGIFGLRVAEVPTTLSRDGRDRPPHLRSWRDGWRHLRLLLLFSPRWLFFTPVRLGTQIVYGSFLLYVLEYRATKIEPPYEREMTNEGVR